MWLLRAAIIFGKAAESSHEGSISENLEHDMAMFLWFHYNFQLLKLFLVLGFLKTSKVEIAIKAPKLCLLTPEAMTDFYEEAKTAMGLRFILSL